MGVIDELDAELEKTAPRCKRKIDKWLESNEDRRGELAEAAEWFVKNRGHDFGFRNLSAALCRMWPDFPVGSQHLRAWLEQNHPEAVFRGR